MQALTPAERRGALVVVLLLGLGALRDLLVARHPALPGFRPTFAAGPEAGADRAPDQRPAPSSSSPDRVEPRVDLNRAGLEQLDALPGIGPVLAGRILAYRRDHGPFGSVEELLAVRGIGPRLLERLRPRVQVSTPKPG